MQVYPHPLRNRPELNLRHAIKSSIPEIRQLIALTLALYLSERQSNVEYGYKEGVKLLIRDEIFGNLSAYFSEQIGLHDKASFSKIIDHNPLYKAQMEPLQVALELFLKLCKVSFPDGGAGSRERTGSDRYIKVLHFTTNAEIIRLAFEKDEEDLKWILFDWITSDEPQQESEISARLKRLLTIFSEETQFRLREESNREVIFQQEGVYKALLEGNTVDAQDSHENVGPFRILKSYVGAFLHPFLQEDKRSVVSSKQFVMNPKVVEADLKEYAGLVSNYLDVLPKRTTITFSEDEIEADDFLPKPSSPLPNLPRNRILYGPPGSGKSFRIDNEYASGHAQIRVTFHPDSDYHSFVGSYKPVSKAGMIDYDFVPQAFTNSYISAWSQPKRAVFLIVEEINRGNCAQIFGDLFQCLDRNDGGYSVYPVDADTDLANYLKRWFEENTVAAGQFARVVGNYKNVGPTDYQKLILPSNLFIYATMNTSDQSLFPMDSAFKRRWDWEYIPIDYADANRFKILLNNGQFYSWGGFIRAVNTKIYALTQSEDKQLGNRFINPADQFISQDVFKSKVMFYLWSELYKNETENSESLFIIQPDSTKTETFTFSQLYEKELDGNDKANRILPLLMNRLELNPIPADA